MLTKYIKMTCSEKNKCPFNGEALLKELKEIHPEINEKCIPGLIKLFKKYCPKGEECCKEEPKEEDCCCSGKKEEPKEDDCCCSGKKEEKVSCSVDKCDESCEDIENCQTSENKEECCKDKECCK